MIESLFKGKSQKTTRERETESFWRSAVSKYVKRMAPLEAEEM